MDEKLKKILTSDERYSDFTLLDDPVRFDQFFADQHIQLVQVHSTQIVHEKYIVGFCGQFAWKDNVLISIDGDTYNPGMTVLGYDWFEDGHLGKCLEVLVGDNW